jgi:hypothetical protein
MLWFALHPSDGGCSAYPSSSHPADGYSDFTDIVSVQPSATRPLGRGNQTVDPASSVHVGDKPASAATGSPTSATPGTDVLSPVTGPSPDQLRRSQSHLPQQGRCSAVSSPPSEYLITPAYLEMAAITRDSNLCTKDSEAGRAAAATADKPVVKQYLGHALTMSASVNGTEN